MGWVLFIAAGGIGVPTAVFLTARHLVHQHGDPADAHAYLEWFHAQKAAERAAQARAVAASLDRPRQKELTHR